MKTFIQCKDKQGVFVRKQVNIKIALHHNLQNGIIAGCARDILKADGYDVDDTTMILVSIEN